MQGRLDLACLVEVLVVMVEAVVVDPEEVVVVVV